MDEGLSVSNVVPQQFRILRNVGCKTSTGCAAEQAQVAEKAKKELKKAYKKAKKDLGHCFVNLQYSPLVRLRCLCSKVTQDG